jgi:hypothetical protein
MANAQKVSNQKKYHVQRQGDMTKKTCGAATQHSKCWKVSDKESWEGGWEVSK